MTSPQVRAALYARVSSDKQAEEDTIASQVAALQERCRQDQVAVEEELSFIDDGYTGTTLVRPALERLRDLAATGMLDRLYVHSPDRLARKYAYQVLLLDELQRSGVEVVFLNHAIGTSPEDQLLLQVQGMVAEYERAKLLERCRRGKLHTARQGCVNALAGAPFGYRYVRKAEGGGTARYDILLEEARIVQQIFDWVGWDPSTVCDMLRNPAYKGTAVYGRWQVGPRRPRLRPARGQPEQPRRPYSVYEAQGPGVTIAVPALVSPELFAAVAEQLDENRMRNRQSRRGARWLLQGLLVCQECGYALYGLASRCRLASGRTVEYAHYRCMGRNGSRFGGRPVCSNRQVPVANLDNTIWNDVCDLLRNPAKVRAEYQRRRHDRPDEQRSLQAEQVAKQISKVKQAITRLIDAYQDGVLDKQEFTPRLQAGKERLARLQAESQKESEHQSRQHELRLALGGLEEFAQHITEGLAQADWHKRREIIRALVKRIEVGHEEIRIIYRVSPPPFVNSPGRGTFEHCGRLLEAPLPHVARRAVRLVVAPGVGHGQRLEDATDRLPGGRRQQQVEVVGQQAVAVQTERVAQLGLAKGAQEGLEVVGAAEDGRAVVAAVESVVDQVIGDGTRLARHEGYATALPCLPSSRKKVSVHDPHWLLKGTCHELGCGSSEGAGTP
jgi:site-specific DNA recombinase